MVQVAKRSWKAAFMACTEAVARTAAKSAANSWHTAFSLKLFALLFFPLLLSTLYTIDQQWEVIGDFEVLSQEITPRGVIVEGILEKQRSCRFIEAVALTSDGQLVTVTYESRRKFGGTGITRPLGKQMWGPWVLDAAPGEKVTLTIRHRCHFAWEHTEKLSTFTIAPLVPKNTKLDLINPLN